MRGSLGYPEPDISEIMLSNPRASTTPNVVITEIENLSTGSISFSGFARMDYCLNRNNVLKPHG
jgi:hypothetical protein